MIAVVKYESESLRCVSDLELKSDRWCVNFDAGDGALVARDC